MNAPAPLPAAALPVDPDALDGNAAAGVLAELFAVEMTDARARCAGCGAAGAVASLRLYGHGMGLVLRCPGCGDAVLRVGRGPRGYTVDLRGAVGLEVAAPAS